MLQQTAAAGLALTPPLITLTAPLSMESPPPVPPKDSPYAAEMDTGRPSTSGSKRKRAAQDDDAFSEPGHADAHTPKRTRPTRQHPEVSTSDEGASAGPRSLKRKKKSNNLSNLNLRHQAERQASEQSARESRFQEGSLRDKPSEKPPSAFTRVIRTDSGNIEKVDQLMEDYHESMAIPPRSVEAVVSEEKVRMPERVNAIAVESAKKEDAGGMFRFGRSFSNFHPIALWQKIWRETKEELTERNYQEAMRKKQKEEAEARYAQLKQAGQLGLQPVGKLALRAHEQAEASTPRDSAVAFGGVRASHDRTHSHGSQQLEPAQDDFDSEVPDTASKMMGSLRSRLSFRKPSIPNFKHGMKRVKSDFSLAASAGNRDSSDSATPVKFGLENSAIKRSASRYDLKKQTKLSKRVSDLETKLQQARRELDEALVEASPMPKIHSKYERFTPQSSLRKFPKFVPGQLPSLPSERILMVQEGFGDDEDSPDKEEFGEVQPHRGLDISEAMGIDETEEKPRARQHSPRADALFKLTGRPTSEVDLEDTHPQESSELTRLDSNDIDMDPDSVTDLPSEGATVANKPANYSSLDAKLKALDANVKIAKKGPGNAKKRKSGGNDGDKTFKPGKETTEDDEFVETPMKKRKASGVKNHGSPQTKRTKGAGGKSSSPRGKKAPDRGVKKQKAASKEAGADHLDRTYNQDELEDAHVGAEEIRENALTLRTSLDSQGMPLEPLYEEEEETTTVPINDEPSKSTATATPARHGRARSPHKRSSSTQPGVEEQMMTLAAKAAKTVRAHSPAPSASHDGVSEVEDETVSIVPGEDGVPALPEDETEGMMKKKKVVVKKSFEWPADVF